MTVDPTDLREVVRDGVRVLKLTCPRCGTEQDVDQEQARGEVSLDCSTEGCDFHETINLVELLEHADAELDALEAPRADP